MSALTLWWIVTSNRPGFESQPHHLFALGKFLELPEPQFPNLYNGNNNSTQLVILLYRLNEVPRMKQILLLLLFSVLPSPGVGVGWTGMGGGCADYILPSHSHALVRLLLCCFLCLCRQQLFYSYHSPTFPSPLLYSFPSAVIDSFNTD